METQFVTTLPKWLAPAPGVALPDEPSVRVVGYAYYVDMGASVRPRLHAVYKDKTCSCGHPGCPAVQIVAEHLRDGRVERAPDPPTGYTPYLPRQCPICDGKVFADHSLSSPTRGIGWLCASAGLLHYWQDKVNALMVKARQRVWLFPPVVDASGRVTYRGVRWSEIPAGGPMGYLPECNR